MTVSSNCLSTEHIRWLCLIMSQRETPTVSKIQRVQPVRIMKKSVIISFKLVIRFMTKYHVKFDRNAKGKAQK